MNAGEAVRVAKFCASAGLNYVVVRWYPPDGRGGLEPWPEYEPWPQGDSVRGFPGAQIVATFRGKRTSEEV